MSIIVNKLARTVSSLLAVAVLATSLTAAPSGAQARGLGSFLGGVVIGAVVAAAADAASRHQPRPVEDCGRVRQRVYTQDGDFAGYRWVPAC